MRRKTYQNNRATEANRASEAATYCSVRYRCKTLDVSYRIKPAAKTIIAPENQTPISKLKRIAQTMMPIAPNPANQRYFPQDVRSEPVMKTSAVSPPNMISVSNPAAGMAMGATELAT